MRLRTLKRFIWFWYNEIWASKRINKIRKKNALQIQNFDTIISFANKKVFDPQRMIYVREITNLSPEVKLVHNLKIQQQKNSNYIHIRFYHQDLIIALMCLKVYIEDKRFKDLVKKDKVRIVISLNYKRLEISYFTTIYDKMNWLESKNLSYLMSLIEETKKNILTICFVNLKDNEDISFFRNQIIFFCVRKKYILTHVLLQARNEEESRWLRINLNLENEVSPFLEN